MSKEVIIVDVISPKTKVGKVKNLKFLINDKNSVFNYGDCFNADILLNKLTFTSNFLSFDYNKYLFSNQIYFQADVSNTEFINNNIDLRNRLIEKIKTRFSTMEKQVDKEAGDFLCGLFFNHRNSKKQFYEIFKSLNIAHFLAFSGLHLTFFLFLTKLIPARFSLIKNFCSIMIIGIAILVSGGSPSILRASFFFIFVILSDYFGRTPYYADITALYSIFHILINPWIIFNNSFLLSVIFFTQLIIIKNSYKVSFIFFLQNLILFGSVSLFSPFLNILLTFIFPFIMFAGICAFFSYGIIFELSLSIIKLFLLFISYLNKINIIISPGFYGIALSIVIIFTFYFKNKKLTFFIIILILSINIYVNFMPYVLIIDTGHGQAILVNTLFKGLILFDSGNQKYFSHISIENFLNFFNLKIKSHFISHFDYDHYSATDYLSDKKLIAEIFIPENIKMLKNNNIVNLEHNFYKFKQGNMIFQLSRWGNGDKNENSFSYIFSFNNKWFGIFSDQSASVIRLMSSSLPEHLDYFVVSHHGGKGSLDSDLIKKYTDSFFIISCGNSFSNPSTETMDFLTDKKVHITKEHGALFMDVLTGIRIQLKKQ